MTDFQKTLRASLFTTLFVSMFWYAITGIYLYRSRQNHLQREKDLLSMIADDVKLPDNYKKEFFKAFIEKTSNTDDVQTFDAIVIESFVEVLSNPESVK